MQGHFDLPELHIRKPKNLKSHRGHRGKTLFKLICGFIDVML
jgi:hypothetical protein